MSNLSREHMDELWRRMTQIFGSQWTSQHGEVDHADTWLRGLSDFTPQDLSIGLEACAKMKPDEDGKFWAPSLPQFRNMCKPRQVGVRFLGASTISQERPSGPILTKEEKLKWIEACRKALKTS